MLVSDVEKKWFGYRTFSRIDPLRFYLSCLLEWQSTPIFLPGESHGQRSLASYSPWGHK